MPARSYSAAMSVQPRLAVLAILAAGGAVFGGYYLWPSGRHLAACPAPHALVPAAAQRALAAYADKAAEIAQSYRDRVADGRAMVVRRAVVDRRQTLHVRETIHFPRPKTLLSRSGWTQS